MIKQLRKKFIRISIAAVASVMVLLCVTVNVVYFLSVNASLNDTLDMITDNQGRIPEFKMPPKTLPDENERGEDGVFEDKPEEEPDRFLHRRFNEETPFSTRFFVLYYTADGTLVRADLEKIAAVTDSDVQDYLSFSLRQDEGYGFTDGYKYKISRQEDGTRVAVFLNDYEQIRTIGTVMLVSALATVFCIALICVMIVLFSKRAMEPVIESDRKQKQFITDASHELKTPITVIRTSLRVLEMEVGAQKWIDKAVAQTDKLADLVNSLVTLSKLNESDSSFHISEFNVSDALSETAESFADFAQESGKPLQIRIEPDLRFCGDEYAVRQLASVLLDNAVKYASEGTSIEFSLEKEKRGICVRTKNMCDELNVEDLDKLFDRFYRADKSRNGGKSGFGIGLSMAKTICEAHRGSICARSADGHSVEFVALLKNRTDNQRDGTQKKTT